MYSIKNLQLTVKLTEKLAGYMTNFKVPLVLILKHPGVTFYSFFGKFCNY